jgi:glutamate-1-semialdehyde 2,1-aminomutase
MRPYGVEKSYELHKHALEVIPGGTQLISRRPTGYAYGVTPVFSTRSKGCRFWDVDGNEYIDLQMSVGTNVLGYADDVVDNAVIERIRRGPVPSVSSDVELELADELIATIPCAEMVRFCKGGGEANVIAIRIARASTGRDKIAFCGYHGWHDWYLSANLQSTDTLNNYLLPGIEPVGVPKGLAGTAIPFEWENLESLENLLTSHRGEVAAIIMEAARTFDPKPGYLEGVRELATKHDVVLIFDEVVTGFRLHIAGAQGRYGVIPDMATFAKAISNGYPFGAVTGRREVMSRCNDMFVSSTYWSDPITATAALTTIREYKKRGVQEYIEHMGKTYMAAYNARVEQWELPLRYAGTGHNVGMRWEFDDPLMTRQARTYYVQECNKRGIFDPGGWHLSWAHTEAELQELLPRMDEVFALIKDALEKGDLSQRLEASLGQQAFRRLVS